jgi:hypothetical protein
MPGHHHQLASLGSFASCCIPELSVRMIETFAIRRRSCSLTCGPGDLPTCAARTRQLDVLVTSMFFLNCTRPGAPSLCSHRLLCFTSSPRCSQTQAHPCTCTTAHPEFQTDSLCTLHHRQHGHLYYYCCIVQVTA